MPQLNVAPSPSPVVAPPASSHAAAQDASASASAAPSAAVPGSGAPEKAPEQPFAALLRHQMSQKSDSADAADKAVPANLATAAETAAAAGAAQPTTDAITAIAQMLAGIVPPAPAEQAAGTDASNKKSKKTAAGDSEDPVMLATSALPILPTTVPLPNQASETSDTNTAKPLLISNARANQAENLAADAEGAASRAVSAKDEGADFAALLAAAPRDVPAAAAAQANAHAVTGAEASTAHIQTPVGARGWDNEVGEKLTWMVTKHETTANLVLNPPQLGRIEVSISMNGDQATANFVSASATVRDALENALPRLREVLQDAGISLGQTQVGAESFQQSAGNRENGDNSWRGGNASAMGADPIQSGISNGSTAPILRRGDGLVDTFA